MRKKYLSACLAMAVLTGCATTAGGASQKESTIYDTHRRVVKLEQDLSGSIQKLNETSAELIARVDQNDNEMRRLRSMVEENQMKLDNIAGVLLELRSTIYRQWNISTGSGFSTSGTGYEGEVTIEPPAGGELLQTPQGGATGISSPTPSTTTPTVTQPVAATTPAQPAGALGDPKVAYQAAQKAYAGEDYAGALAQFDGFVQQYPQDELVANAQFWKAKCYLKLAQYRRAIQEFELMRVNHGSNTKIPFAMYNQAVAHSKLGEFTQASALLQQVVASYPGSPAADEAKVALQQIEG